MVYVKPYNRKFLLEKIVEYNKIIKVNEIGNHKIVLNRNASKTLVGYGYEKENDLDIETLKLYNKEELIMELSAREVEGTYCIIKKARGRVGIIGLGLGYVAMEIAKKKNVKEVIVYEKEKDVIQLFEKNFGKQRKIKIIHGNGFEAKKDKFDYFYTDIYGYELSERIVSDYKQLMNLHQIKEYVFCGVEHFLLSATYEEIIWVFIPELWMEMSKRIFAALQETDSLKNYKKLNEELVSKVLSDFKVVLNEGEA
ncbi:hypothetical protein [uncultured Clostridium sp.]|uniref:hypothetical protein n=1 Tax=uncultured Clostridium sp. TaxID=59620 RepID=UPI0026160EF9|nr:hypothetical protein [uncultured Clostridium sp.]